MTTGASQRARGLLINGNERDVSPQGELTHGRTELRTIAALLLLKCEIAKSNDTTDPSQNNKRFKCRR